MSSPISNSAEPIVQRVADVDVSALQALLERWGISLQMHGSASAIPGSHWGEDEAGLIGNFVHVRADTPIHSVLHESAHYICMDDARRQSLDTDAGGDDIEEAAVCYLQILIADQLPFSSSEQMMRDMDRWGYSFRLGNTRAWFDQDAEDALEWLLRTGLLDATQRLTFKLRR